MKKSVVIILMLVLMIVFASNTVVALNVNQYTNIYENSSEEEGLRNIGGKVLGIVQVLGTIVSIAMFIVMGMKYMFTSVEEKAEMKKKMFPFLIGAILLFGGTGILTIIANWAYTI